jgi:hypothetical protein
LPHHANNGWYTTYQPEVDRLDAKVPLNVIWLERVRKVYAALTQPEMEEYIHHHIRVAGIKKNLFEPSALVAIQQGSAGSLRRANQLASGGLVAAATEQSNIVTADHIRTAASELV